MPDLRQTSPILVSNLTASGEGHVLRRCNDEDLLAGYTKCRKHFLQGVIMMSGYLLFNKFSPGLYIDEFCVRIFFYPKADMRDFEQGDSWRNYFLKRKFAIANELEERGKGLWAWPKISPKNFPPHGSLTSFLTSAKRSEMVNCAVEADKWKSEGGLDESIRYPTQASLNFSLLRYYNAVHYRLFLLTESLERGGLEKATLQGTWYP